MNKFNVAVVGATGVVGEVLLELLAERKFPINTLYPLASSRSAGSTITFSDKEYEVLDLAKFDFTGVNFAFFSAGAAVSADYVPKATDAGCIVIDNTSHFRYDDNVPLIVPEVNAQAIETYRKTNIIANPNCSTIQMLVALKPIYDAVGIDRINVATYQAVSGAGNEAVSELARQTAEFLNGNEVMNDVFPKQMAFNVLPQIDVFEDNGYTREEMKMVWETQKIFGDHQIKVNPTAVRVPVFYGHSEAIHIETDQPLDVNEAITLLNEAPGVLVIDHPDYPTPITHAASQDAVFVARIRKDISHPNGLNLWVTSDNVRKGAALNAIQIAEMQIANSFYFH